MKLHNAKVFVEIDSGSASGRAALDTELSPQAIFVPVDDLILAGSENTRFVFRVVELSAATTPRKSSREFTRFALRAEFNKSYLGFGITDRRLVLQHSRGSPGPNFSFIARLADMEDWNSSPPMPISIKAADGGVLYDPEEGGSRSDVPLRMRFLEGTRSRPLEDIESTLMEQMLTLTASCSPETSPTYSYSPVGQQQQQQQQPAQKTQKTSQDASGRPANISGSGGLADGRVKPRPRPRLDNKRELEMVQAMRLSGDLEEALAILGKPPPPNSANAVKTSPPPWAIKVAKLCAVMSQCTYMRDQDFEEEMKSRSYAWDDAIRMLWSDKANEDVVGVMNNINLRADMARRGIAAVAKEMGLKYQPLCNFSETGNSAYNGPYCGAFYNDGPSPFIVIAFKGSGTVTDFLTDVRCRMRDAGKLSPLKGRLHSGFFNGMFDDFPARLSDDRTRIETEVPFRLINLQLERLMSAILTKQCSQEGIQLWTTGHSLGGAYASILWAGLLSDPYPLSHATIRDLFTFGSPRVGNRVFAEHVDAVRTKGGVGRRSWRIVNEDDVIPRVPVRPILRFWSSEPYVHMDTHVELSARAIGIGSSEMETPPPTYRAMMTAAGKAAAMRSASIWMSRSVEGAAAHVDMNLPEMEDHSLQDGYWPSLSRH